MSKHTAQSLIIKASVFSSLVSALEMVPDHRSDQGKRFSLSYIIGLVLLGFLKGKTSIESCSMFGKARMKWLVRWFDVTHGVPDPTTIARALKVTEVMDVVTCVNQFLESIEGVVVDSGISVDGKTVKAISDLKEGCKHFLSMFSHDSCRLLDQEGVTRKENEITATPRMIQRHTLIGSIVNTPKHGEGCLRQVWHTERVASSVLCESCGDCSSGFVGK